MPICTIYRNEMEPMLPYFLPTQDYFTIGATITHNNVSLTVEHMCQHPIDNFKYYSNGEFNVYNTIYFTITSKP